MSGHFVYLYRDHDGAAQYAGYGGKAARASSHETRTHNAALRRFIRGRDYTIEIAGPFGTEKVGRAVETAVMSALNPICNIDKGAKQCRFRPLGISAQYSDRRIDRELDRRDFLRATRPVLFVHVNEKRLGQRPGYTPERPPSDRDVLARMREWWQLGGFIPYWITSPATSPALLVAVHGKPGSQIVIGAVKINRNGWKRAKHEGALYSVPLLGRPGTLDAFGLRGRRISSKAGLRFGSWKQQFYILLNADGSLIGGNRLKRVTQSKRRPQPKN